MGTLEYEVTDFFHLHTAGFGKDRDGALPEKSVSVR